MRWDMLFVFFFFKQKTAYEIYQCDWSSDVCSSDLAIQVAVMGCVVNGPGEAREADIGIAAGKKRGHLFIKGQVVRVVPESEMVDALVDEARKLAEEGVDARLAAAEANAEEIAAATREQLIEIRGDANNTAALRAAVAQVAEQRDA